MFSSESMQLLCSCDVNQKYKFHWFPNHLFYIDHRNTKFSYIYTRWTASLIYTINKNNNKNNNKNKARKTFEKFPLNEKKLSVISLLYTLNDIVSFNFFQILLILTIHQYSKF